MEEDYKKASSITIGDTPAVNLGYIDIPISATTELNGRGELVLKATPNMREVRELIEQVFIADHDRKEGSES